MKRQTPEQLFADVTDPDERALVIARFMVLREMGFFGEPTNVKLSFTPNKGTWLAAVRKHFSGLYGDVAGCHPADIEVAAEMLGVFEPIFNAEVEDGKMPKSK